MKLKSVEKKENNQTELAILVERDAFEAACQKSYRKNVGRINVQGFRKGRAPRKLIEKLYGAEIFYEDAMNFCYGEAYEQAVKESGINPVDHPSLTDFDIKDGEFSFKALVTVKPEVTIKEYKGLEAEKTTPSVTAKEVNAELDRIRERNARLVTVDREAKNDDLLMFDFEGFVDGTPFPGGKAENYSLKLGSNMFIPGFEEQLIGKKAGDECEVSVTFPKDYQAPELAEKDATFKCTVHEVKESVKPELDDEFAKDVSEFDTLDAYKADLKEKMHTAAQSKAENEFQEKLMDQLLEGFEAEVPQVMFEHQLDHIVEDFGYRLSSQGITLDAYLKMNQMEMSSFRLLFDEQAKRQVKIQLALEKAAEMEHVEVSQQELDEEYGKLVEQSKMSMEQIKEYLPEDRIKEDLIMQKINKVIVDTAIVAVKEKKPKAKKTTKKETEDTENADEGENTTETAE